MRVDMVPSTSRKRFWLAKCLLAGFLSLSTVSAIPVHASTPMAVPAATPAAVVKEFYEWYLIQLMAARAPILQDKKSLLKFISPLLIKEIDRKIHSPDGLDADYFIKAQDYADSWAKAITVKPTSDALVKASVIVSLGGAGPDSERLSVSLVKDGGAWKIRKVSKL